jgi:hypothetical protein
MGPPGAGHTSPRAGQTGRARAARQGACGADGDPSSCGSSYSRPAPPQNILFIATSRITADAAEALRLPRDRTVIMGSRIEI